jgi:2-polyprenyl-3-methyl-5-hydroxy-6-metoxy-1,4-benzoquinol methylase
VRAILGRLTSRLAGLVMAPINWRMYKQQKFVEINERPLEYAFALQCLVSICPQRVLDVGPGLSPWPAIMAKCGFAVTAIDEMKSYWRLGIFNQHFYIVHDDIVHPEIAERFDFITCISSLEHIPNHDAAVRSMFNLLRPNGHIVLTFPYNDQRYVSNVYREPGAGYGRDAPYICQVFSSKEVDSWLEENRGRIVRQEFYEVFSGDLWTFGERLCPPRKVRKTDRHHLTAMLVKKD